MKKTILGLSLMALPSVGMANPILTCKSSGAGGALIKQIVVERGEEGFVVKAETYDGGGLTKVNISKVISTSVSLKLVLEGNTGAKTSLVMYEKRAVILHEAKSAADFDENGATVEFLSCK